MSKNSLRRGFKAESNRLSERLRQEMGLQIDGPLCPWRLADYLGVKVIQSQVLCSESAAQLPVLSGGKSEFSAVTLFSGQKALVIYNSLHTKKRQASDISHELAHILLRHSPSTNEWVDGQRHYDKEMETEANWLGPALLISEPAAFTIARDKIPISQVSDTFQVTENIIRMRLSVLNVVKRIEAKNRKEHF